MGDDPVDSDFIELTAGIVAAYVSHNPVPASDIPALIDQVHGALAMISTGQRPAPPDDLNPMVPIRKSVTPDYLICLEDGRRFK